MRLILVGIAIILLLGSAEAQLVISEIMFDPDDGNEWIEIYHNGSEDIDVSALVVKDNFGADQITCCAGDCTLAVQNYSYFVIFDLDTTFNLTNNTYFCVDDKSIGNGLGNSEDVVELSMDNKTIDYVQYNNSVHRGSSISLVNSSWRESIPTPWEPNFESRTAQEDNNESSEFLELTYLLPAITYTGKEYGLIKVAVVGPSDVYGPFNISISYNLSIINHTDRAVLKVAEENNSASMGVGNSRAFGTMIFNASGEYLLCSIVTMVLNATEISKDACLQFNVMDSGARMCNVSIQILTEKTVFNKGDTIKFENVLSNDSVPFLRTFLVIRLRKGCQQKIQTQNHSLLILIRLPSLSRQI